MGRRVEDIALRLGISEPTLRKYYFRELDQGGALVEAVLDEAIWKRAMAGSVSAQRLMKEMLEKGRAAPPVAKTAQPAKLGKKAAADAEARTAHEESSWAGLLTH